MRVIEAVTVGIVLWGCAEHEAATSPAGSTQDSGTRMQSAPADPGTDGRARITGDAAPPVDVSSCTAAPPWPTPQVLAGEVASVTSQCGQNGNPPPLVGPLPATNRIYIAVGFIGKADELARFAQQVSDPSSPLYRHYLTPAEVTARFGPSECNYQAVIDWLEAGGVRVEATYADRFLLDASGTVSELEALLHVTLSEYRRPDGTTFYAPDRDPSVTVGPAIAIDGLDNCFVSKPIGFPNTAADAGSADASPD